MTRSPAFASQLLLLAPVLALASSACAGVQRPYTFRLEPRPAAIDDVVRALAANGQQATTIDERAGVIHTAWSDTGFMYGEVHGITATIVRRYTVALQPESGGHLLILRADGQRCARGMWQLQGDVVVGSCEDMNGDVVPDHQGELDRLGQNLQSTLASGLVVVPSS